MRKLLVVGGSAGAKIVANLTNKYWDIYFYNSYWHERDMKRDLTSADLDEFFKVAENNFFIAAGDNKTRSDLHSKFQVKYSRKPINVVHPTAYIEDTCSMGSGNLVLAGAYLGFYSKIGDGCILNTGAIVEHDCRLEDFVQLAPGAALGGRTVIGSRSFLGIKSCVLPDIEVCSDVIVAAGAVQISNVDSAGTYVGVPARKLQRI
jgi:sugar O-acyltransferase (sialic acid O-acetyltransferase NeuD family)